MEWSCVGHEQEKSYLSRLLAAGELAHAYLFTGPEGIGKRMIAEDLIRVLVGAGPTMDILRLAPERDSDGKVHDIPIEAVRGLKQWLSLRPTAVHKVVLIDDADQLGGEAANTLLKVLEEPPAYAHFFLVTARPGSVLPTIVSRCEEVQFKLLADSEFRAALGKRKLDDDDRALLELIASGRPGAASRLIDDSKLPTAAKAITSLQKGLKGGVGERFVIAKDVAASPDADDILEWWLSFVHAKLGEKPALAPVARGLLEVSEAFSETGVNRRLALERFFLEIG